MKSVLLGLWVTLVALGSAYGAAIYWPAHGKDPAAAEAAVVLQHQKTRVLNVPIITNGAVQGFIALQLDFTMDGAQLKALQVPPEVYILDEAFRALYTDRTIDLHNLQKYDLAGFTSHVVSATNAKLGAPLIKDVLIVDFSYIPKTSATP